MVARKHDTENRQAFLQLWAHKSDEVAMARLCSENPELVQLEMEYYAAENAAKKMKAAESEAGPLTIIF
ncbi:hypothetical protein QYE76_007706 [Lolium multiflorum]|uniref:Uncharacterized protein n=1 Tax=Lolium multiflorum TaxID=4521 RepID=A0AAD8VCC8_LOLMU|nr:hypothetical protein QYE76_007706 [Lolium multiflorum]